MRIAIYGAGAIGAYLGAHLAEAGEDVALIARGPHLEAMRANGLRLIEGQTERTVLLSCTADPHGANPQDYVVLAETTRWSRRSRHPGAARTGSGRRRGAERRPGGTSTGCRASRIAASNRGPASHLEISAGRALGWGAGCGSSAWVVPSGIDSRGDGRLARYVESNEGTIKGGLKAWCLGPQRIWLNVGAWR
jgi:choline dehydrogenase-like flavoprotein